MKDATSALTKLKHTLNNGNPIPYNNNNNNGVSMATLQPPSMTHVHIQRKKEATRRDIYTHAKCSDTTNNNSVSIFMSHGNVNVNTSNASRNIFTRNSK